MRLLRPSNWPAVSAEYRIPAFPCRGSAVISCNQFSAVKRIAQTFDCRYEPGILFTHLFFYRSAVLIQRTPLLDLLDVFHNDDIRLYSLRVFIYRPWKHPDPAHTGLSTFGLTELRTVRRSPHKGHMTATNVFLQINLKDILCQMKCFRVIDGMHPYGLRIMVDSDIYAAAYRHFDTDGSPSSAGKTIYYQVIFSHLFVTLVFSSSASSPPQAAYPARSTKLSPFRRRS